jgi:hypothetical protein
MLLGLAEPALGNTLAVVGSIYLLFSFLVALYGRSRRYPVAPLLISALFLSPPVVLLVVTIAAGPEDR